MGREKDGEREGRDTHTHARPRLPPHLPRRPPPPSRRRGGLAAPSPGAERGALPPFPGVRDPPRPAGAGAAGSSPRCPGGLRGSGVPGGGGGRPQPLRSLPGATSSANQRPALG